MYMPADGSAFKDIEDRWLVLKEEPHNLKLSMAENGINPFGEIRFLYSIWPIFVINNNIHPLMYIKREHIMFSMIVTSIFSFNSYLINL